MGSSSVSIDMLVHDAADSLQRFSSKDIKSEEQQETYCMESDEIPILGRDISFDGLMFLSRENSKNFSLSREVSVSFTRENSVSLTRDVSVSFLLEPSVALSRENSNNLNREGSASLILGRESSYIEVSSLITSADVHDFLREASLEAKAPSTESCEANYEAACTDAQYDAQSESHNNLIIHHIHCATSPSSGAASSQRRAAAAPTRAKTSRRGLHVKGRPDMQQTARDGAVHWCQQVKLVRAAWGARAAADPLFYDAYQGQIELSQGRIKSKQECLLRALQLAAADGLIVPGPFAGGGFFGWTRFDVVPERAAEFRTAVEGLFAAGFREDALKETFRRSGLVPERWQWTLGWAGHVPWLFMPKCREK